MAQLKDTTVSGDLTVSGKLNNEILDVDDNCIIIDVCRRLDLSTVGNKIEIALPDGYICNTTAMGSNVCLGLDTWGLAGSWSTNAAITISCVDYRDDNVYSSAVTLSKNLYGKYSIPYAKSYIKVEVTTAAVGTETYASISGRIFCKKIA